MKSVLYITNLPAPYRVEFFELLAEDCKLTVIYERKKADNRDDKWRTEQKDKKYQEIYLRGFRVGEESSFAPEIIRYLHKDYDVILVGGYSSPTTMLAIWYMRLFGFNFGIVCDGILPSNPSAAKAILKKSLVSAASFWLSSGATTTNELIRFGAKKEKIFEYPFSSIHESEIIGTTNKNFYKRKIGCSSKKMALFVGQFIQRKGLDILLKAIHSLHDSDLDLYCVGGSKPSNEPSQDHVYFIDFKTKKELADYYKAADFLVLPTRSDVWGLVVNEAMGYGLPVITTTMCGAGLEMIRQNNTGGGYLVPPEDPEALEKAIQKMLDGNYISMGRNALEIARKYTIEKMVRRTLEIINIVSS